MKRTDQERIAREFGRQEKLARIDEKRASTASDISPGAFAKKLSGLLLHDGNSIYNIPDDENVLEILLDMQESLEEKELDVALKKAIKLTKVKDMDTPFDEMKTLLAD